MFYATQKTRRGELESGSKNHRKRTSRHTLRPARRPQPDGWSAPTVLGRQFKCRSISFDRMHDAQSQSSPIFFCVEGAGKARVERKKRKKIREGRDSEGRGVWLQTASLTYGVGDLETCCGLPSAALPRLAWRFSPHRILLSKKSDRQC